MNFEDITKGFNYFVSDLVKFKHYFEGQKQEKLNYLSHEHEEEENQEKKEKEKYNNYNKKEDVIINKDKNKKGIKTRNGNIILYKFQFEIMIKKYNYMQMLINLKQKEPS